MTRQLTFENPRPDRARVADVLEEVCMLLHARNEERYVKVHASARFTRGSKLGRHTAVVRADGDHELVVLELVLLRAAIAGRDLQRRAGAGVGLWGLAATRGVWQRRCRGHLQWV